MLKVHIIDDNQYRWCKVKKSDISDCKDLIPETAGHCFEYIYIRETDMIKLSIIYDIKSVKYNPTFNIRNNYDKNMFDYILTDGDMINNKYRYIAGKCIHKVSGKILNIPKNNPFSVIKEVDIRKRIIY
jgi:hypothetical protein